MPRLAIALTIAALAVGCRRDVELTIPRSLPTVPCLANGGACAKGNDCCSGSCVDGHCALAACRAEGAACAAGATTATATRARTTRLIQCLSVA